MPADLTAFVEFLVLECEDAESTDFVDDLLAAAKAQITAGKGSIGFVQSAGGNGKHVARTQGFNCLEVALACRRALASYNDTAGSGAITFPDFSAL